jgi:hypothetical protein
MPLGSPQRIAQPPTFSLHVCPNAGSRADWTKITRCGGYQTAARRLVMRRRWRAEPTWVASRAAWVCASSWPRQRARCTGSSVTWGRSSAGSAGGVSAARSKACRLAVRSPWASPCVAAPDHHIPTRTTALSGLTSIGASDPEMRVGESAFVTISPSWTKSACRQLGSSWTRWTPYHSNRTGRNRHSRCRT